MARTLKSKLKKYIARQFSATSSRFLCNKFIKRVKHKSFNLLNQHFPGKLVLHTLTYVERRSNRFGKHQALNLKSTAGAFSFIVAYKRTKHISLTISEYTTEKSLRERNLSASILYRTNCMTKKKHF